MHKSTPITNWLVLGPIYNPTHQTELHSSDDRHPLAQDIIMEIERTAFDPKALTRMQSSPREGDISIFGTDDGKIFPKQRYIWQIQRFGGINWDDISDIGDNIHKRLALGGQQPSLTNPFSFADKRHALAFFLVYVEAPEKRTTKIFARSDDSLRVWLNGTEIDALRFAGDRDITAFVSEVPANIKLNKGHNVLLVAVAETHVEWGSPSVSRTTHALR